mgnify:FL=1
MLFRFFYSSHSRLPVRSLLFALLLLVSCVQQTEKPGEQQLRVLCTTRMLADPVRELVPPHVQVDYLMGTGVDPHLYKPTPADVRRMLRADLILHHGLHLEGRMSEILLNLDATFPGGRTRRSISVCDGIPEQQLLKDRSGATDPHLWRFVEIWISVCKTLKDSLSEFPTLSKTELDLSFNKLERDLQQLNKEVHSLIQSIPEENRILVTAHDAFGYFGKRYGLEVYGIQGISTESEPSLLRVNELVRLLSDKKIPSIFVESTVPERNVRALIEGCQKLGHLLTVGGTLYSDAPGPPGSGAESWRNMVLHNAITIAKGLK